MRAEQRVEHPVIPIASYYGSYGKGYDYGGTYRKEND